MLNTAQELENSADSCVSPHYANVGSNKQQG